MPATSTASLRKGDDLVLGAFRGDTPVYNPLTFYRNFAQLKTLNHGIGPAIDFTRASDATYFDADGTLQTATTNAPRFDHSGGTSLGLLIEEQRTNSIRNSQAGGAVVGTPGTLPTHWNVMGAAGLSTNVVGFGSAGGFDFLEVQIVGTASSGLYQLGFDVATQVVASAGQSWATSCWVSQQAGTLNGISLISVRLNARNSGGSTIAVSDSPTITPSALLSKHVSVFASLPSNSAFVQPNLRITVSSGAAIDITLRIAAPQLEQGAFATSYIPTTGATATRAADNAVVTPISSFYNQAEGTLFAEGATFGTNNLKRLLHFDNGTTINRKNLTFIGANQITFGARINSNSPQVNIFSAANLLLGAIARAAGAYASASYAAAVNGVLSGTSSFEQVPEAANAMYLGGRAGNASEIYNGHIRKVAYWPKRLTNELLQQLTA